MRRLIFALAAVALAASASAQVYVHGYTKSNGTYVAPHYRSAPDSSLYNNYSARGNVNPYTGQVGTKNPNTAYTPRFYSTPSSSYSSSSQTGNSDSQSCMYYSPC
jgi:hypothetical protein